MRMHRLLIVALALLVPASSHAEDSTHVFWGDLHLHSNRSPDAFAFGNTALSPEDAIRFARGHAITSSSGQKAQLKRPLDFLLVSDHAEFLGVFPKLISRDEEFLQTNLGKRWIKLLDASENLGPVVSEWAALIQRKDYVQELSEPYRTSVWQQSIEIADRYDDPGHFTAFVGYEWTSMVAGNNLHRVVLFRDGMDKAGQLPPFTALDSLDPEDLWQALAHYEKVTGGEVMAIPHNGNVSNGMMFALETVSGEAFDTAYLSVRRRWEPVYEVTQVKGDGETHPFLSPDDEFADFETWDEGNITRSVNKENSMLAGEYARSGLLRGLELGKARGMNPYQFGLIGSTDSHTAMSTSDDNNFFGKFRDSEPGPDRLANHMGGILWLNWKLAASGYAGIWAKENTRESLFDALKRKEVYATTGPRIPLRFFGGWRFDETDLGTIADTGYRKGVPMGSELPARQAQTGAPQFLISALKDPDGANLDRIQVVKGYLDSDGTSHEKVFDVAWEDGREMDENGRLLPVGSTVNIEKASYANTIGSVELAVRWQDPEFAPDVPAFYYVRVLEIPTPRWTAYDAARYGVRATAEVPMVTVERVYSSPIWYNP